MMGEPLDEKGLEAARDALRAEGVYLGRSTAANLIRAYLSATALPDGMDERLRYRVENPSAWPEGFDQEASDLMRDAAGALAAMRVEVDRNATEYETVLNSYADENQRLHDRVEAAEQQVRDMRVGLRNALAAGLPEVVATSIRLLLKEDGE